MISCVDPGTPSNGARTIRGGFIYLGSVQFTCRKNYELDGVSRIYCKINGNWSRPLPKCVLGKQTPVHPKIFYREDKR